MKYSAPDCYFLNFNILKKIFLISLINLNVKIRAAQLVDVQNLSDIGNITAAEWETCSCTIKAIFSLLAP